MNARFWKRRRLAGILLRPVEFNQKSPAGRQRHKTSRANLDACHGYLIVNTLGDIRTSALE